MRVKYRAGDRIPSSYVMDISVPKMGDNQLPDRLVLVLRESDTHDIMGTITIDREDQ